MYKKIIYNIVEEQFDQPVDMPKAYITTEPTQIPQDILTPSAVLFRMDSRSLWNKYIWELLNYGVSLNNNLPGTEMVNARVLKNADAIGDFIVPYYGLAAGQQLSQFLATIGNIGVMVVKILKDNGNLKDNEQLWLEPAKALAEFLYKLNPDNWPKDAVEEYLQTMLRFWVEDLVAKHKQDWNASDLAINNLEQLVITGITSNDKSFPGLADVFSRGIIAQYPDRFAL